jgi:hypothetical protein
MMTLNWFFTRFEVFTAIKIHDLNWLFSRFPKEELRSFGTVTFNKWNTLTGIWSHSIVSNSSGYQHRNSSGDHLNIHEWLVGL